MACNRLKECLTVEGRAQAELARVTNISLGTINKVCNNKKDVADRTKYRLLAGLNKLAGADKYGKVDVFPEWRD